MTALNAVSYNLGCGGPHPPDRTARADEWAYTARDVFDLVFVQEFPTEGFLDKWRATHQIVTTRAPQYRVRSALLVRNTLEYELITFPTTRYHGSYLAAAAVRFPDGRDITCVSVHASPSRVVPKWRETWEATGAILPNARGGQDLWDADLLLASMLALVERRSLLIAGDWNEARAWDDTHPGTCGEEFFQRVADGGLVDCTWEAWHHTEVPTCVPSSGNPMQVDHIFATPDIAATVKDLRVQAAPAGADVSDHFPISFTVLNAGES